MSFQDFLFSDHVSHYLTLSGAFERSTRTAGDLLWTTTEGREEHLVHELGPVGWEPGSFSTVAI